MTPTFESPDAKFMTKTMESPENLRDRRFQKLDMSHPS